jgi:predicted small lipoprotein YifL
MVPAIQEPVLTTCSFRLAVIGVLALSFALSACGRKGPLDPPPRAQAVPVQPAVPGAPPPPGERLDEYGNPVDVRGNRKSFPLDFLLN